MKNKMFSGMVILNGKKMTARALNAKEAAQLKKDLGGEKTMIEAVKYMDNFTIGNSSTDTGMIFGQLPSDIALAVMIAKGCGWLTLAVNDKEMVDAIVESLGGKETFEPAQRIGSTYSARYSESNPHAGLLGDDSGTWDMGCLGPGL